MIIGDRFDTDIRAGVLAGEPPYSVYYYTDDYTFDQAYYYTHDHTYYYTYIHAGVLAGEPPP